MRLSNQVSSIDGVRPEILLAMFHADSIIRSFTKPHELVLTSVVRKVSTPISALSLHTKGLAFDLHCRSWGAMHDKIVEELQKTLGRLGFDVIHETPVKDYAAEHVHIEYDPDATDATE